jgi:hypothetical protein
VYWEKIPSRKADRLELAKALYYEREIALYRKLMADPDYSRSGS